MLAIFLFIIVLTITVSIVSLLWLMLDYEQKKRQEKLDTISKIIKENNMNREQAERLYDLFMN